MNFSLYFEATQTFVDKLKSAIKKVDKRPFPELFGSNERFLVKVFNPKFEKALAKLGYTTDVYDEKKRTILDKNYSKWAKGMIKWAKDKLRKKIENALPDASIRKFGGAKEIMIYLKTHCTLGIYEKDSKLSKLLPFGTIPSTNYDNLSDNIKEKLINYLVNNISTVEYNIPDWKSWEISLTSARRIKQTIDQGNVHYYLLFSRHPIDVLRMSDHKGISSCHRLGGGKYSEENGMYQNCALADAKNDGGIVYLIKGSDGNRIRSHLNDSEIFEDKDRDVSGIKPLGRIRLRRFIDLQTGDDFAVPATLRREQDYGYFTKEVYNELLTYVREHQSITKNPPTPEYAEQNIVMVGGNYSDDSLEILMNEYFNIVSYDHNFPEEEYFNIRHKDGGTVNIQKELDQIVRNARPRFKIITFNSLYIPDDAIRTRFNFDIIINKNQFDPQKWAIIQNLTSSQKKTLLKNTIIQGRTFLRSDKIINYKSYSTFPGYSAIKEDKIILNFEFEHVATDPFQVQHLLSINLLHAETMLNEHANSLIKDLKVVIEDLL